MLLCGDGLSLQPFPGPLESAQAQQPAGGRRELVRKAEMLSGQGPFK